MGGDAEAMTCPDMTGQHERPRTAAMNGGANVDDGTRLERAEREALAVRARVVVAADALAEAVAERRQAEAMADAGAMDGRGRTRLDDAVTKARARCSKAEERLVKAGHAAAEADAALAEAARRVGRSAGLDAAATLAACTVDIAAHFAEIERLARIAEDARRSGNATIDATGARSSPVPDCPALRSAGVVAADMRRTLTAQALRIRAQAPAWAEA